MFGLADRCDDLVRKTKVSADDFWRRKCKPLIHDSDEHRDKEHGRKLFLLYLRKAYILETVCDIPYQELSTPKICESMDGNPPESKISRKWRVVLPVFSM